MRRFWRHDGAPTGFVSLGLDAGTIHIKSDPEADRPDVSWQCRFAASEAHAADLDARAASPEFSAVRDRMYELVSRFERIIEHDVPAEVGTGSANHDISFGPVVPQEATFASGDLILKGYLYFPPGPGPHPLMITNHGSTIEKGTDVV